MVQMPFENKTTSVAGNKECRDWGHLPAVAVQCLGRHCCSASKAKLRAVCRTWHDALSNQFTEVFLGPGSPWPCTEQHMQPAVTAACYDVLLKSFPAAHTLHVTASSTRDYPATYTQDLAQLLCSMPGLMHLTLQELHELEDFDNLDPASLWDGLYAAAAAPGGLVSRLVGLSVSDCFWNTPELFGVLKQLTGLTQLRLSNNPLETACEVGIIASLTQLKVLELGLIFDGSSQHHDMPRALEQVSNLTRLQELSIPMWRRSLGGRAHPLAPSLAAVLSKLTGLTSLAVDGKFGHLTVVSCLTNLQRLASAAPLSTEGWRAISQLPQLTLLTSLTPASEPLRLNPTRPHGGLDLGMLSTKGCLQGLDVAVMQPEYLATLGQFTALQRLNLRCAETFQQPQQQAQLLTALSCLPGGLTSLTLGPLLPLSTKLLTTIAKSCPLLQSLSARFSYVLGFGGMQRRGSLPGTAAAARGGAAAAAAAEGRDTVGDYSSDGSVTEGSDNVQMDLDTEERTGPVDVNDSGLSAVNGFLGDTTVPAADPLSSSSSSSGVSAALRRLQGLTSLELVLLTKEDADEDNIYGTSGGGGGAVSRPASSAGIAAAAAAGVAAHADRGIDVTGIVPGNPLVHLALEDLPRNLKRLMLTGPWQLGFKNTGFRRVSSAAAADDDDGAVQQQQQMGEKSCAVCGRSKPAVTAAEVGDSAVLSLCHCLKSLGVTSGSQPVVEADDAELLSSSTPSGRLATNHKRPGTYSPKAPTAAAAAAGGGLAKAAAAAAAASVSSVDAAVQSHISDVFLLDGSGVLEKKSRSLSSLQPAAAAAAAATRGNQNTQQQQRRQASQLTHTVQQQQQQLPVLSELCLFKCHIPYSALVQLVSAVGLAMQKLQLLQLHTNPLPQQPASPAAAAAALLSPRAAAAAAAAARTARLSQNGGGSSSSGIGTLQDVTQMTTEQLLQLPIEWATLEEWHLHPHHLWGLLKAGCFSSSSSSSIGLGQQQQDSRSGGLWHVSQLLNLRRLHVVDKPCTFSGEHPSSKDCRAGDGVTPLPLHDKAAVEQLLQQLQQGLQQMPGLRQLLLYLGHITKQQPDLPDDCHELWTEAGERLLGSMPACKVKHYLPLVGSIQHPAAGSEVARVLHDDRIVASFMMETGPQGLLFG